MSGSMIKIFGHGDPLIKIFDEFREEQSKTKDSLAENYKLENFNYSEQEAFSIGYKNNQPCLFSTIFRRDWWPAGSYRILNRTWKLDRQSYLSKNIDPIFLEMIEAQISWLRSNRDFKIAFISREHNSRNTLLNLKTRLNTRNNSFEVYQDRVWVCPGPAEHCLQDILYTGDSNLLSIWKLKD